jgi:hypothetical protein
MVPLREKVEGYEYGSNWVEEKENEVSSKTPPHGRVWWLIYLTTDPSSQRLPGTSCACLRLASIGWCIGAMIELDEQ